MTADLQTSDDPSPIWTEENCQGCKNLVTCLAYSEQIVVAICSKCVQSAQIIPMAEIDHRSYDKQEISKLLVSQKTTLQNRGGFARRYCPRAKYVVLKWLQDCPTCKKQAFFTKNAPKRRRSVRWYAENKPCKRDKKMPLPLP